MQKVFILFSSILFLSKGWCETVSSPDPLKPKLSKEFCQSLMVSHTPDADVAYHAGVDVDGNEVASADLENPMKLNLPTVIPIPIKANLGAYLRNSPPAKFQQAYANLTKNGQTVTQNNTTIQQNLTDTTNNATSVNNALQQVTSLVTDATTAKNTAIAANPAADTTTLVADSNALTTLYNTAISNLTSNVNSLNSGSQAIVNNISTLKDSLGQLGKQISPAETNTYVLQTNANLVKQNQADLQSTSTALSNLSSSFSSTQTLITNTLASVNTNATQLGTTNVTTLKSALTTLQNSLNAARSTAQSAGTLGGGGASTPSQQTQVNSLVNSFQALEAQQNKNVAQATLQPLEADLGQVTYNLKTGELLYNGQPLEASQQTQLKKDCEKVLKDE